MLCNLFKILFTNKVKHTFAPSQILYICALRWWAQGGHILFIIRFKGIVNGNKN